MTNETPAPNLDKPEQYSVVGTLVWMLTLSFGTSLLISLLIAFPMLYLGYERSAVEAFMDKANISFMMMLLTMLISYPLLKIATFHSLEKGLPKDFLAIKPINFKTLAFWLSVTLVVALAERAVMHFLQIPTSEAMLNIKANVDHAGHMLLVVCTVVVLAPIYEELVFRGMAYHRIENSRLGTVGAIIIPTLVFNLMHLQYSWLLLVVLLPGSFLLAFARYKTANVNYCIAMHMLFNALALWFLFN